MKLTVRQRFREWWFDLRHSRAISRIPWSAIRRIGQSRLLALTIVVPFLGSLLLFNQSVVDILTLSPEVVRRWFHLTAADPTDVAHKLTVMRLYYLYFGLTFLGVGSALFVLFCPLDIKNYSSAIEYQTVEGPLVSKPKMTLIFPFVAYQFSHWSGDELDNDSLGLLQSLAQPSDFLILYSAVISEMYGRLPADEESDSSVDPGSDPGDDNHPYEDFRHRPAPSKIAHAIHSPARIQIGFVETLLEMAVNANFRNDVLALSYMALDHTKPYLRLIIAAFYGLGFGLLLIPTVQTFFALAINVFWRP
ncbi:hypothetical protein QA639_35145 [Bradyrhizobium pachyrhizi]|uniref:hypothetical protein n=1 Tax=Bradyrhizobium pachyrhizi TaxID=280333 RepID=UPI0024B0C0D2|nr:hypothetical protein [Bradyrhizobium pachyrhizi]WFU54766.1 hypothetical protein QA639_35145 [Bradyrhizobium pachyrhizi]